MVRRQIQLTDDQDAALRREAVAQGLSIAAVILRAAGFDVLPA